VLWQEEKKIADLAKEDTSIEELTDLLVNG